MRVKVYIERIECEDGCEFNYPYCEQDFVFLPPIGSVIELPCPDSWLQYADFDGRVKRIRFARSGGVELTVEEVACVDSLEVQKDLESVGWQGMSRRKFQKPF